MKKGLSWLSFHNENWQSNDVEPSVKKKRLIVFIHGIFGSTETWFRDDGKPIPFVTDIFKEQNIQNEYDIAVFSYHTKLIDVPYIIRLVYYLLGKQSFKSSTINELSELLIDQISLHLTSKANQQNYISVDLICHSMGGLVGRKAIIDLIRRPEYGFTVRKFFALATPNNGSFLANVGNKLTKQYQIEDLSVFSDFINNLNNEWHQAADKIPECCYFAGYSDPIVDKGSAFGYQSKTNDQIGVEADHSSILHPEITNDYLIVRTIQQRLLTNSDLKNKDNIFISTNLLLPLKAGNLYLFCVELRNQIELDPKMSKFILLEAESLLSEITIYSESISKEKATIISNLIIEELSSAESINEQTYSFIIDLIKNKLNIS